MMTAHLTDFSQAHKDDNEKLRQIYFFELPHLSLDSFPFPLSEMGQYKQFYILLFRVLGLCVSQSAGTLFCPLHIMPCKDTQEAESLVSAQKC